MNEKGIIKFRCSWVNADPLPYEAVADLNRWRCILYNKGLVGVDCNGVGFGNLSKRYLLNQFVITGSGTGQLTELTTMHYTLVTDFSIGSNWVEAKGPVIASSESLTHAALYQCDKAIKAVFHIHNLELWKRIIGKVPTTLSNAEYGTPQMAMEIKRLYRQTDLRKTRVLVMAGHQEGIMAFGLDADEAGMRILSLMKEYKP